MKRDNLNLDLPFIEPYWCPDCGDPRNLCRCDDDLDMDDDWMQGDDWNYDADDFDVDDVCPYCNGTTLDLSGDSGGTCPHCIRGIKPR